MLENENIRQISTDVYELTGNIYPDKTIKEFTGKLYGNGHSIIGINSAFIENLQGELHNILFENLQNTVVTENNGVLKDCEVTDGNIFHEEKSGFLCKINNGTISDCAVTGTVRGKIAGLLTGENAGTIRGCQVEGTVYALEIAGGICGTISTEKPVQDCTVSATILSASASGGLIGSLNSKIKSVSINNCAVTGLIEGQQTGSFIGNVIYVQDTVKCQSCKTTDLSICTKRGSAISADTLLDCSFDITLVHQGSVLQTYRKSNYNFFIEDSEITVTLNTLYNSTFGILSADLKSEDPYRMKNSTIKCVGIHENQEQDLADILELTLLRFNTTNSRIKTELKEPPTKVRIVSTEEELYNCHPHDIIKLQDNICLTKSKQIVKVFHGELQGNNYTIKNIQQPLFERISHNGVVSNVNFKDSEMQDLKDYTSESKEHWKDCHKSASGFLSRTNNGKLEDITLTTMNLASNLTNAGSLVGRSEGKIADICIDNVTVSGKDGTENAGSLSGLVHAVSDVTVKNINITSKNQSGGLCGTIGGGSELTVSAIQLKESTVKGKLAGGIAARVYSKNIQDVHLTSSMVKATKATGGIYGSGDSHICNSEVTDTVIIGKTTVGGLVGEIQKSRIGERIKIKNCIIQGEIIGKNTIGGVAAKTEKCIITQTSVNGRVIGEINVSGFVSEMLNTIVEKSYCINTITWNQDGAVFSNIVHDSEIKDSFTLSTIIPTGPLINVQKDLNVDNFLWSSVTLTNTQSEIGTSISTKNINEFKTLVL